MQRTNFQTFDAQAALGFVVSQTAAIEARVYEQPLPEITYQQFIPITTAVNPWVTNVIYRSMEGYGAAQWFNSGAYDIPNADVRRSQFSTPVYMAAIGYEYDIEEINQAQMLGIPLEQDKVRTARRAYEDFVQTVAYVGDTSKGMQGLINTSTVTATTVANGASPVDTEWEGKTADEILKDINTALSAIYTGTNTTGLANTILLPPSSLQLIATKRLNDLSQTTILQWVLANNVTTATTGEQIVIRALRQLETAGVGPSKRMVVYRRDPDVLQMYIPMPHRFYPAQQVELTWKIPGIFRLGGLDVRQPKMMGYWDGI